GGAVRCHSWFNDRAGQSASRAAQPAGSASACAEPESAAGGRPDPIRVALGRHRRDRSAGHRHRCKLSGVHRISFSGASAPMRRLALLSFPLVLASCITMNPRSAKPSASAVTIPDMPMQTWGIESCGAGSLSTVLQYYGDSTTMQQWDAELPKIHGGDLTVDMVLAARQ